MSSDKEIKEQLEDVKGVLNTLVSLFKAANYKAIEQTKLESLKTEVRKKIYDLCDGNRSVQQIAQEVEPQKPLKQSQPLVSYHLAILTSQGLVNYRAETGQKYYYKTLD